MYLRYLISILFLLNSFAGIAQTHYVVNSIPFDPIVLNQATEISLFDDQFSDSISIGFPFTFFGNTYTSLKVSANGFVSFNDNLTNYYVASNTIPSTGAPSNSIMLTYFDLNPGTGGSINYQTQGVAPNRIFVLAYDSVHLFGSECTGVTYTGQLQLFEDSNSIEIHITNKELCPLGSWANKALEGIQNENSTIGYSVPGRNTLSPWEAFNDSWRFLLDTNDFLISGRVIADINGNCIIDSLDYGIPGQALILNNGSSYTLSDNEGAYYFDVYSGTNLIQFNTLQSDLPTAVINCPANGSYLDTIQFTDTLHSSYDFFVYPNSYCVDPRVVLTPVANLQSCDENVNHQIIFISNYGFKPMIGYTATFTFPDQLSILHTEPEFTSQIGQTLTWNFSDTLLFGEYVSIEIFDSLSCQVADSTSECFQATVESIEDCDSSNSHSEICQYSNLEFLPYKIQLLDTIPISQYVYELVEYTTDPWYTFRIELQNTYVDTCRNLIITDFLSPFFDHNAVELLSTTHSCDLINMGNGNISFILNNIQLTNSLQDPNASIVSIVFRVKSNMELTPGMSIHNLATINLSSDVSINTNYAIIEMPTNVGIPMVFDDFSIFPNPADRFIQINSINQKANRISIIDLNGRQVLTTSISKQDEIIATDQLANGVYFIEMFQDQIRIGQQKLIISHN